MFKFHGSAFKYTLADDKNNVLEVLHINIVLATLDCDWLSTVTGKPAEWRLSSPDCNDFSDCFVRGAGQDQFHMQHVYWS